MVNYSPITRSIQSMIREKLGDDIIISAPELLSEYASDASKLTFAPELVVCARNARDIQVLMELANNYNFPVTPRGGGSGPAGDFRQTHEGVVLFTGG